MLKLYKAKGRIRYLVALLIIIASLTNILYANGGPMESAPITKTGNIQLIKKSNITIKEESIDISIDGDYLEVKVVYHLKNNSAEDKVKYGFPVEHQIGEQDEYANMDTINGFKMYDGDKPLNIKEEFISEENVEKQSFYNEYKNLKDIYINKTIKKWFITELAFKAGEEKILTVHYTVRSQFCDWGISGIFFEAFDTNFFTYDLTPAGNWGSGIVQNFRFALDANKLIACGGKVAKLNLEGYRLEKGIYSFEKKDFDLSKQQRISFVYDNTNFKKTNEINRARLDNKYIKSIRTSSCLGERYSSKNMFDGSLNTAWVEGVKGIGKREWIEVEFTKGINLGAICIANGYLKSDSVYKNNGKIKNVMIERYYKGKLVQEPEQLHKSIDIRKYNELNKNYYGNYIDILSDTEGFNMVDKVRITILDAYKGEKYEDTCISELFLIGHVMGTAE